VVVFLKEKHLQWYPLYGDIVVAVLDPNMRAEGGNGHPSRATRATNPRRQHEEGGKVSSQTTTENETRVAPEKPAPAKVTVTVNLPEPMAVDLRSWAAEHGKTFTQALKEAIVLKLYVEKELQQDNRLFLERPDGSQRREIVFHLS
jgi:hypothetical protein